MVEDYSVDGQHAWMDVCMQGQFDGGLISSPASYFWSKLFVILQPYVFHIFGLGIFFVGLAVSTMG